MTGLLAFALIGLAWAMITSELGLAWTWRGFYIVLAAVATYLLARVLP